MEGSFEQSTPPPVDAEQLNKFSDENKEQNDTQVMFDLFGCYFRFGQKDLCAKVCFVSFFLVSIV